MRRFLFTNRFFDLRFNHSVKCNRIDDIFKVLITSVLQISHDSGGLVDPTVKPLAYVILKNNELGKGD